MNLDNFSSEAKKYISQQAYDHVFFSDYFQWSLDHVLNFEKEKACTFIRPDMILSYLYQLANFGAFFPYVSQNIRSYITYARGNYSEKSELERAQYFDYINQIVTLNRENEGIFNDEYLHYRSSLSFFDKIFFQIIDKDFVRKNMVYMFLDTVLLFDDNYLLNLCFDSCFLDYVKFLMRDCPELLLTDDFLKRVFSVLKTNASMYEEEPLLKRIFLKSQNDYDEEVAEYFFRENKKIIRKLGVYLGEYLINGKML